MRHFVSIVHRKWSDSYNESNSLPKCVKWSLRATKCLSCCWSENSVWKIAYIFSLPVFYGKLLYILSLHVLCWFSTFYIYVIVKNSFTKFIRWYSGRFNEYLRTEYETAAGAIYIYLSIEVIRVTHCMYKIIDIADTSFLFSCISCGISFCNAMKTYNFFYV